MLPIAIFQLHADAALRAALARLFVTQPPLAAERDRALLLILPVVVPALARSATPALQVEEVAKVKLQKSKQLRVEAAKDWREINDGTLRFKRQDEEVAELRQLGKQDLLNFMQVNNKLTAALLWAGRQHCGGLRWP